MASVEVKILPKGVGAVFNEGAVVSRLEQMGNAIKNEANSRMDGLYPTSGFRQEHFVSENYKTSHGNTAVQVKPNTILARRAQASHSVLTQSMDAGRS